MDMGSSRFIPAVRGEPAGRDKDADIALLLKYSYELPDFLSRCRRFPVLNLRLDTGRLGAQGVAIRWFARCRFFLVAGREPPVEMANASG